MRYLDGFRNPEVAQALSREIGQLGEHLATQQHGPITIMEVCGSHTMAIARHGIRQHLPPGVSLVSGPGCPVCVTPPGYIDAAIELATQGCHLYTFGDMVHVPGSHQSLADARAAGASVTVCYSPDDAFAAAQESPQTQIVFLAVGFETTIAPTVALLERDPCPQNLSLLTAFKCVPPALQALRDDPELNIDAFLCPAHVSAIIGADAYLPFTGAGGLPCVIAGFEPLDILLGIRGILQQVSAGKADVDNQYARVVRPEGNTRAQQVMERYLAPSDADWRGLGTIPKSALSLRPEYVQFDAESRFDLSIGPGDEPSGCACGDVIKGKMQPQACPRFGSDCTPSTPVGPCMVSSEGSCAAAFRYAVELPANEGTQR